MDAILLEGTPRTAGKGATRAARRNGLVPCVIYGGGITENVLFEVPELALRPIVYTPDTHTVQISVGGESYLALLKSIVMHPVSDRPFHADFLALRKGEKVRVSVSLRFIGMAPAVRAGLVVNEQIHELEVFAEPQNIPGHIDVDVSGLTGVHDAVRVSDLVMPEGVTTALDPDTTVAAVVPPAAEEPETAVAAEATETAGPEA